MNPATIKLTIAALIALSAVAYLALTGLASGWVYYMTVDELLASDHPPERRLRLGGMVGQEHFHRQPGELRARFQMVGENGSLAVDYRGVVPPMLAPGIEVVVEGRLESDRHFTADVLLTKCASKYQAEEHANRLENEDDRPRR